MNLLITNSCVISFKMVQFFDSQLNWLWIIRRQMSKFDLENFWKYISVHKLAVLLVLYLLNVSRCINMLTSARKLKIILICHANLNLFSCWFFGIFKILGYYWNIYLLKPADGRGSGQYKTVHVGCKCTPLIFQKTLLDQSTFRTFRY